MKTGSPVGLPAPPGSTLDFNAATPEPASVYLTGAAALALLLLRKGRKQEFKKLF